MNTERSYFGSAAIPGTGRVYVFGGQNLEFKALNETEVYDCLRLDLKKKLNRQKNVSLKKIVI
jgi:hypothetical protein